MKTIIKSLADALEMIAFKKTDFNIVSIRSTVYPKIMYDDFDDFKDCYKDIIVETFDDIIQPKKDLKMAEMAQIHRILQWAKGKDNIMVHCSAGICRSSAVAYLIECMTKPPEQAVKLLDKKQHYPNEWVVKLGSQLFNNRAVYTVIQEFNIICEHEIKDIISRNSI